MTNFKRLALALLAAAFCASTPAIAADAPGGMGKANLGGMMKDKAAAVIEQGQQKVDNAAANLENKLGIQKNATEPKSETLDVTQETVTVETPQGTASETTTTITPEAPAAEPQTK